MIRIIDFWIAVLRQASKKFNADDGWAIASHVALSGLFALFPFLIFATSIAAFFHLKLFEETVVSLIFDTWPPGVGEPLAKEISSILTVKRIDVLTIGGFFTAVFASNGVEAARVGLNRSYREQDHRGFWWRRLQSLVFVLISIVVLFAITIFLVLLPLGWKIAETHWSVIVPYGETVWLWRTIITIVVATLALIAGHLYLPAGKRNIVSILPGVCFTLIFWLVVSLGFGMFLEQFANYFSTYVGLTSAMIGLLFLYLLGVIFIFGGEINAEAINQSKNIKKS